MKENIKVTNISEIHRYINNGMYTENYLVKYRDGKVRMYKIRGAMVNKHLMVMINADNCVKYYSKSGRHVMDCYQIF